MRKIFVYFFVLFFSTSGFGQSPDSKNHNISIRLFTGNPILKVNFIQLTGKYSVYGDSIQIFNSNNFHFSLSLSNDSVAIITSAWKRNFHRVRFAPLDTNSSFKLDPLSSKYNARIYDDELLVSAIPKTLKLINVVNIEKYVAGVVQWEVGLNNPPEFNKVKTIVCRTYALGNWRRHAEEGFQLCDGVHCQVFKGKTFSKSIHNAAMETAEYILVDDNAQIINAAFSSNCGGQTMNSEDVWSKTVPSLRSLTDTFCLHEAHAHWQKKIPKDLWLDYLRVKYKFPVHDTLQVKNVLNFNQPGRMVYLASDNYFIPLKFIREDMKLKSTFFNIKEEGNDVVFYGRGYGHGVGLCQEGAKRMAELGYSYTNIINHYYTHVHLIRFSQLDFFKNE